MSTSTPRQAGVTLIELIMFIVIVSVAVVGVLGVLTYTSGKSADPLRRKQALMLAEGLLEEVQLAGFTYCQPNTADAESAHNIGECTSPEAFGAEAGDARPFDNVNDYVAAPNTPASAFDAGGVLVDVNGKQIDVQGYTASLTVRPEVLNGIGGTDATDPDVLRITVEVAYDNGEKVVLDGYRTRYAPRVQ